ncbi:dna polymerase v [Diaporthe amygdali]|uniref:dna polymerase v n=1 Tax=Phomopsis amygdali TaxID=1214568 RepID=UPI0022FE62C1|nr:dna polymerase v [Diaporthe amygdali]KAJ0108497.1 dna polymerase v [Diaporthe amygdali]
MPPNKRKHRKENPNTIEPSQKRVKTGTSAADVDVEPAPKPVKFEGGKKKGKPAPAKPLSKKQLLSDKSPFPEEQDRNIEAPLYELLGSEDPDERLQAADVIISKLLDNDGVSESSLDRHLEKRLFRGLASSRKASRLGFSVVLTEILQQLWGEKDLCGDKYRGLTFDFVLNTLTEKTKPVGNIAGQEEKDHYFGQLFGIECFVRAKILFDDVTRWNTILALLIKLAKKKVWLKPQCAWIILQTVPQMDQQIAEETLRKLDEAGWAKTPDAVAITVILTEKFPKIKLPSKSWRDFLSSKYLGELPAVLKDSGKQESKQESNGEEPAQKQKQASWTAQLHFVWDIILAHYVKLASTDSKSASDQFKQFWSRVVDQGFFSKTASEPQKFTGFMIFQKFLEGGISHSHITHNLFSQNLLTCLMNQAAKQDRYLHRAATKALKAIEHAADTDRDLVPVVLQFLLGKQGAYNFDQRSNSKTVDKLLHLTKPQHAQQVIKTVKQLVLTSEGDSAENHIMVYADYLFRLSSIVPTEADTKNASKGSVGGPALQEFAKLAYPKAGEIVPGLSEKTKPILRQKLTAALAKFVKRPEDFAEFCNAIMLIDSSSVEMDEELQTELLEALEKLQQLTNPKQAKGHRSNAYQGLALLYAVAILQLYNAEPDALDILHDLRQCHEKLLSKQKGEDGDVSALLVEILLAMVARPSSLMRQTADRVFEAFTSLMTEEALTLLTDTLAAKEDAEGLRALFDTDADMEDVEEAGGSDEEDDMSELGSDVEFVDAEETQDGDGDSENEGQDGDDGESEEDEDEEEELNEDEAKLKALDDDLAKLLNSHRLDKDKDAASSDDDSDMSDSEMIALDEKLAAAFKSRVRNSNKKKENKDAKETVVNFKHRTLDLLAIFARKEAANPLVYKLLLPLLQMMRTTKTKDLGKKAGNIIAEMAKAQRKAKASSKDDEKEEQGEKEEQQDKDKADLEEYLMKQLQLLESIHGEMTEDESHAFAKSASKASLLVVGDILSKNVGYFQVIWDNYGGLAMQWAMYGGFQFSTIIADWTQWIQSHPALVAKRLDGVPGKADEPSEADGEGEDEDEDEGDDE